MSTEYLSNRAAVAALALACALTAGIAPSRAADIVYDQQPPEQPAIAPVGNTYVWTGPYIGVYGGYRALHSDVLGLPNIDNVHGLDGGAYAGYNYQLDNNWVAGLEGMLGFSGADGSKGGISVDQDWEAALRARMGYAFESSMIYGLAGVAGTDVNASSATGSDSNVLLGWQVGAGLETMLTQNITGRVEYDYSDYKEKEYMLGASGSPEIGLNGHSVKVGVGFKF